MAPLIQQPEITLAQRLASNDKTTRTKALKTLRKYINLRSQKIEGGFTSEDLLKIWKGLFYCLWMQDKPLLQEEVSNRISGLIHNFHTPDNQLLYFTTFLQTVKREWNGIDRLRLDKFLQVVRFMFREVFEVLKRRQWETSMVNQFLQVFTEQLLQNTELVPKGLMLHILDLYMEELAQVGYAELTAEQNLTFIDPFFRTMAKTKDHLLLTSISKKIFRTIVDHAPFAIEDLIRELEQEGDESDSGEDSGMEKEEMEEEELKNKVHNKTKGQANGVPGIKRNSLGSKSDLDLDSVDCEEDNGVGPVLQFDYGAIADRLFELGSHLNIRNVNRTLMYSLVKVFRNLSAGIFPQRDNEDRYVSDSSDDDIFKKKKKKKKRTKNDRPTTGVESVAKKIEASQDSLPEHSKHPYELDSQLHTSEKEADDDIHSESHQEDSIPVKRRRKSKTLKPNSQEEADGFQLVLEDTQTSTGVKALGLRSRTSADQKSEILHVDNHVKAGLAEGGITLKQENSKMSKKKKNIGDKETNDKIVEKIPEEISLQGQLETKQTKVERNSESGDYDQEASTTLRRKRRKSKTLEDPPVRSLPKAHNSHNEIRKLSTLDKVDEENNTAQTQLVQTATLKKKTKAKILKSNSKETDMVGKSPNEHVEDDDISKQPCPISEEANSTKQRGGKRKKQAINSSSQYCGAEVMASDKTVLGVEVTSADCEPSDAQRVKTKKSKKLKIKEKSGCELQGDLDLEPEVSSNSAHTTVAENKGHIAEFSPSKSTKKAKKKKQIASEEKQHMYEKQPAVEPASTKLEHLPQKTKKSLKKLGEPAGEQQRETILKNSDLENGGTERPKARPSNVICTAEIPPLVPFTKEKKKRKLQTEKSQNNGHAKGDKSGKKVKIGGVSTSASPKKLKMEKASAKSDLVSFEGLIKPPTPLFCKTKPNSSTRLTRIKGLQTPVSETKKVTFGLRNNKTTEFRKTDRSLLVSPDGSSRVAFDPKKMPISGVLKSPSLSPAVSKKSPAVKKRPLAADFF